MLCFNLFKWNCWIWLIWFKICCNFLLYEWFCFLLVIWLDNFFKKKWYLVVFVVIFLFWIIILFFFLNGLMWKLNIVLIGYLLKVLVLIKWLVFLLVFLVGWNINIILWGNLDLLYNVLYFLIKSISVVVWLLWLYVCMILLFLFLKLILFFL